MNRRLRDDGNDPPRISHTKDEGDIFPRASISECRLEATPLAAVNAVDGFVLTIIDGWAPGPEAGQFGPPRSH